MSGRRTTGDDVRRQAAAIEEKTRARAGMLFRALVIEADRRLREKTPVDTGHARGNWNIGVGAPDDAVNDRTEGAGPGSARAAPPMEIGDTAFVTNAVPYIGELEKGHSRQAPAGMVRVTAAELQPVAEQLVSQIRTIT
jgi:hypothetical protein